MKALYSDEELDIQGHGVPAELMQKLQELRKMVEARMAAMEDSTDDEGSDSLDLDLDLDLEAVDSPDDVACWAHNLLPPERELDGNRSKRQQRWLLLQLWEATKQTIT